ncbi:MAG: nucleoside recognition protein [Bacillota bacterium]|nr:MAG: nucleoside recognition protein [Bacillota bacterium]
MRRPGPFDAASRRIYTDICTGQSCIAFNFAARGRRVNDIGEALARGARKGIRTTWILARAVVPAYMAVSLLARTPALDWIAKGAGPLLRWFGLPGEAALPLILGLFVNLYSALGAAASLTLTAKEATILALILSMAHALVVETAVTSQIGVPARFALAVRLGLAVLLALVVNIVWRV